MSTLDQRIKTLEEKLAQAKELRKQIEARQRAAAAKKRRADDTRRKILVGAAILAKVESSEWPEKKMLAMMDSALTRKDDRALFGLDVDPKE